MSKKELVIHKPKLEQPDVKPPLSKNEAIKAMALIMVQEAEAARSNLTEKRAESYDKFLAEAVKFLTSLKKDELIRLILGENNKNVETSTEWEDGDYRILGFEIITDTIVTDYESNVPNKLADLCREAEAARAALAKLDGVPTLKEAERIIRDKMSAREDRSAAILQDPDARKVLKDALDRILASGEPKLLNP